MRTCGCTFGGIYVSYTSSTAGRSYHRRFRSLSLCPLSVECYYFPSSIDSFLTWLYICIVCNTVAKFKIRCMHDGLKHVLMKMYHALGLMLTCTAMYTSFREKVTEARHEKSNLRRTLARVKKGPLYISDSRFFFALLLFANRSLI